MFTPVNLLIIFLTCFIVLITKHTIVPEFNYIILQCIALYGVIVRSIIKGLIEDILSKNSIDFNSLRYLTLKNFSITSIIVVATTSVMYYYNIPVKVTIAGLGLLSAAWDEFSNLLGLITEIYNIILGTDLYMMNPNQGSGSGSTSESASNGSNLGLTFPG